MSQLSYKRQAGKDSGFVASYMRSLQTQETAHAYDFWTAVWCIGAALGRQCVVPRPRAPVYSNWYVVLVADSGVTRKSTAVRFASSVLRSVVDMDTASWFEGRTTPEALEVTLHERTLTQGDARAVISISELVTFLGRERYNLAMPGLLTDLYDSAEVRRGGGTTSGGPIELRRLHVSFLSASTPTWLASAINPDVVEGGFTSRCMFIHSEDRKAKHAWPTGATTNGEEERLAELLASCARRAKEVGEYLLTDQAMKRYKQWYGARPAARDPYRQSFESREDSHVLRLAMCLAANDFDTIIRAPHLNRAIRVVQHEKARAARLFEGGVRPDKIMLAVNRLIEVLIERGGAGVPQTALFLKVRHLMTATELQVALDVMHELEMVDRFTDTRKGSGRKATIWRASRLINDLNLRDHLATEMSPQ